MEHLARTAASMGQSLRHFTRPILIIGAQEEPTGERAGTRLLIIWRTWPINSSIGSTPLWRTS